jgi:hypothetical protein
MYACMYICIRCPSFRIAVKSKHINKHKSVAFCCLNVVKLYATCPTRNGLHLAYVVSSRKIIIIIIIIMGIRAERSGF